MGVDKYLPEQYGTLELEEEVREAIRRKNRLLFGIFPNGLEPPPVFLERFEELFLNLIFLN